MTRFEMLKRSIKYQAATKIVPLPTGRSVARESVQVSKYDQKGEKDERDLFLVELLHPDGKWDILHFTHDFAEAKRRAADEARERGAELLVVSIWPGKAALDVEGMLAEKVSEMMVATASRADFMRLTNGATFRQLTVGRDYHVIWSDSDQVERVPVKRLLEHELIELDPTAEHGPTYRISSFGRRVAEMVASQPIGEA